MENGLRAAAVAAGTRQCGTAAHRGYEVVDCADPLQFNDQRRPVTPSPLGVPLRPRLTVGPARDVGVAALGPDEVELVVPRLRRVAGRRGKGDHKAVAISPDRGAKVFRLDVVALRPNISPHLVRHAEGKNQHVDVMDRLVGKHAATVPTPRAAPTAIAAEIVHRTANLKRVGAVE